MWSWLTGSRREPASQQSPTIQHPHAHCDDCEFSFFNHAATLPFDQLDECQCATHGVQHDKPDDA